MYVEVDFSSVSGTTVTLRDGENFRGFKVITVGRIGPDTSLAEAVSAIGTVDDDGNVWLSTGAVTDLAGPRGTEADWVASFSTMVEYARSHGFLSDDGTRIRAHVEPADASG